MQDCYKLLNVGDVRKDEASIIEVLTAIKNNKLTNDLRLLNYYKEVPVSFGAAIDYVDRDVVEMTVHQLQATSIECLATRLPENMSLNWRQTQKPRGLFPNIFSMYKAILSDS